MFRSLPWPALLLVALVGACDGSASTNVDPGAGGAPGTGPDPSSPTPTPPPTPPPPTAADYALSRGGYGPDAWSLQRIEELGLQMYIAEQLDPDSIDDSAFEALRALLPSQSMSLNELYQNYSNEPDALGPPQQIVAELRAGKMLQAIYSRRQLQSILEDFWYDHFNVNAAAGGIERYATTPYLRDAIRPHILGKFEDLLLATARAPAMLSYLDNATNFREGLVIGENILGLNENYARELMELHTLGVDGGYTQEDVIEVARAFTGWTIDRERNSADGFLYFDLGHDQGPKSILGGALQLPSNHGEQDGREVIAFLATHELTAERLSRLLVQRFISETPPEELVTEVRDVWLATGGDLKEVTQAILMSDHFGTTDYRGKVKRPLVYVASIARATGVDVSPVVPQLLALTDSLGEAIFLAAPPTGYPDASGFWVGAGTLLNRFNGAHLVADNDRALGIEWGVTEADTSAMVAALEERLMLAALGDPSRGEVISFVDGLGSDDQAERVREAAAMLFSTPEFMRH